jgi:peptidoglycan/xylan/chitin deacetylase (PgdA/CDA1 family)
MTVTTAAFEAQMKFLKDKGYSVLTMDQLFDFLEFKAQVPKKAVVITIDDGWRSAYDLAFPVLRKYGFPATLFIYTDLITGGKKTLNWELVAEMSKNGIDIQCHTKTHRNLALLNEKESFKDYYDAVDRELTESARTIKEKLNKDVKYIAYPYGATNHLVISLLKKYGFRGGFSIKRGGNPFFSNNYALNRSMVYGDADLAQFERNLTVFSDEALR